MLLFTPFLLLLLFTPCCCLYIVVYMLLLLFVFTEAMSHYSRRMSTPHAMTHGAHLVIRSHVNTVCTFTRLHVNHSIFTRLFLLCGGERDQFTLVLPVFTICPKIPPVPDIQTPSHAVFASKYKVKVFEILRRCVIQLPVQYNLLTYFVWLLKKCLSLKKE